MNLYSASMRIKREMFLTDSGQRSHVRYPVHFQRVAGVSCILAHLLHYGCPDVWGKILQVHRPSWRNSTSQG